MNRIVLLLILCFGFSTTLAVPARRGLTTVTLSDGTVRQVMLHGDERCHWMTTAEGQPLGPRVTDQALIAREERAMAVRRRVLTSPETTSAKAPAAANSLLLDGSFPTTGHRKLLALLINFANTTPTFPREHFVSMLNDAGYSGVGSFRDYFLHQSRGQLDIETTVTPWITVSQGKAFYNAENTPSLISEALKQIDATVDLRDYDNDGDGILDGLIVIHAGEGQEASGNTTDIWSHSSTIYGMQQDGVSLFRYTIEPELLRGASSTIGVFCHEFGHNLGALDYYDTNYSSDGAYGGTGPWDLMGEGAWNGSGGLGTHPAPFTAWQRWQFGWTEPVVLDKSQHVEALDFEHKDAESYLMQTLSEGDYFFLENIQPTSPWTSDLPGHGLIVTHVIEHIIRQRLSMNNINATYPQGIYTVCADAHSDPAAGSPASYGDLTSSATPFPGSRHHTVFSDETLPSTHSQDGRYGYIGIHNIAESDRYVSFDFIQGDAPQRPVDLSAVAVQGTVRLSWTFPTDHERPISCGVYRDGEHLATIDVQDVLTEIFTFHDSATTTFGLVTYSVDATYEDGLTSALSSVTTRIPPQIATDLEVNYAQSREGFQLTWKTPSELTRCTNNLHYELVDHHATNLRYAHRFRADDLLPFVGYEVRSITFLPQQRSNDASYQISMWRMPSRQGEVCPMTIPSAQLEVVAQRKVSEFSPSFLRTTPFVTRPKIERGYDYFIGVEITSKGLAEIVTDQAELQQGFGNMMSLNGGAWMPDPTAQGNYILSATLAGEKQEDEHNIFLPETSATEELFGSIFDSPFTPDHDLYFPLGFSIYTDGQLVAETTGAKIFIPSSLLSQVGSQPTVTFQLVSTYKEHNESRPLVVTVPYEVPGGILSPSFSPSCNALLYDLTGRSVSPSSHGFFIQNGKKVVR